MNGEQKSSLVLILSGHEEDISKVQGIQRCVEEMSARRTMTTDWLVVAVKESGRNVTYEKILITACTLETLVKSGSS
jgi:hypothetical protein